MGHRGQSRSPFFPSNQDTTVQPSRVAVEYLPGKAPRPARPAYGHRVRSIAVAAAFGLAAIGGLGGAALADDDDRAVAMTAAPPAGMSVQVAEDDGVAQVTVYGMRDTGIPVQAQDDDGDDGGGSATARYVLVEVEIRNAGDAPFVFNTTRVRLHDALGTVYTRVTPDDDDLDDDALGPVRLLRGQELDGDDRARGWLAFAVDDDATLRGVSYRDDDGDDVGIADLTLAAIPRRDDDDWDDDGVPDGRVDGGAVATGDDDDDGFGGGAVATGGAYGDDDDDGYSGGTAPAPAPATGGGYAGGDDGYYGDDDGYYGDDGDDDGAAPAPAPAPAPATGGGYAGGDDDGDDDDDGYDDDGGYSGGGDDDGDDDGGDDD